MRIVRCEVADSKGLQRRILDVDEEEMAALVAGEVVPMAVHQTGEDLRFDLGAGRTGVLIGIALIAGLGVGGGDGRAIGVNG